MSYSPFVKTSNMVYNCNVLLCRTLGMCEITENFLQSFNISLLSRVSPATVQHLPNFPGEHLGLKIHLWVNFCVRMVPFKAWILNSLWSGFTTFTFPLQQEGVPCFVAVTFCFCLCLCSSLEISRRSEWESLMSQGLDMLCWIT